MQLLFSEMLHDLLSEPSLCTLQSQWKDEISEQLQIIQVEGSSYLKLEEDLIRKRKEELR